MASSHEIMSHLLPQTYKRMVTSWLEEDAPSFDYGGFVVGEAAAEARLLGKSANGILKKETHLNLSNIVLLCEVVSDRLVRLLRKAGYKNTLAGTRKTTPGFRLVEKYGMIVGGCDPHRHDLSTMTMLKDNHIWSSGSITAAVHAAKASAGFTVKVEVECQSEAEANEAIEAGADIVMLDNFSAEGMKVVAKSLKTKWGSGIGRGPLIEVSGGLTEENMESYVCDDIDIISTSSIHQGVKHVDFSLKIVH
ncbi:MAG: hypothetical protein M1836_003577 [Candelina mexicana]|nr:MAG: hypothetical protein M1836_003577 [Candelina mexicana]